MNSRSSSVEKVVLNATDHKNIIKQWLKATADFNVYHTRLTNCLRDKKTSEALSGLPHNIMSQLAIKQLVDLIRVMEVELEILLLDMGHTGAVTPLDIDAEYKKLDRHTRVLKKLNQQANTVLLLNALTRNTVRNELDDRIN